VVHLRARIAAAGMALVGAVVVMGIVDSSRCPPEARLRVMRRAYRTIRRDLCVLSGLLNFSAIRRAQEIASGAAPEGPLHCNPNAELSDEQDVRAAEAEHRLRPEQEHCRQRQKCQKGQAVEDRLEDTDDEGGCEDADLECFAGSHTNDVCGPRLPRRGEGWDDPRLVGKRLGRTSPPTK
jgi:hypothetical protein